MKRVFLTFSTAENKATDNTWRRAACVQFIVLRHLGSRKTC